MSTEILSNVQTCKSISMNKLRAVILIKVNFRLLSRQQKKYKIKFYFLYFFTLNSIIDGQVHDEIVVSIVNNI